MKELSIGANLVWQLAAGEAAAAQHPFIESDHLLIGICSLEKVLHGAEDADLGAHSRESLQAEYNALEDILRGFELDSTQVRRCLRRKLGKGISQCTEKVIHRSPACKQVFESARALATAAGEMTCIHLLAAILEQPGKGISSVLDEAGVKLEDLRA